MAEQSEKEYRKISRDFKSLIELTKKTSQEELTKIFFEMCNLGLNSYIETEKERNPDKSVKEIIIDMYKFHDELKIRSNKLWKLYTKMRLKKL